MAEAEIEDEIDDREEETERLAPGEETELPGSVQLYLQEIGAVRLLVAAEEVELAKEIENGRLLTRYQRELAAHEQPLSYDALARYLLHRAYKLTDRVRTVMGGETESYAELLFSDALQSAIQMQIDPALAEAIADVVGTSGRQVADDLWELSVASRLLTPEAV